MGNFSQNPDTVLGDSLARGYWRVRFQQGKPVLDRELNLAADLASPRALAARYVGDGAADAASFQISGLVVASNDFTIKGGRCLVGGLEAVLPADTTYRTQPNVSHVAPLPAGPSNVYLRVVSREVTGAEDAGLLNAGDVGFETAVREKVDWEVIVSVAVIGSPDHFLLAVINTTTNTVQDRRRLGVSVASVRDEVTRARGAGPELTGRLDASLAADGSLKASTVGNAQLAAGAAPIAKLASTLVVDGQFSVAAAPAGGPPTELAILLQEADAPAFFLVSMQFVAPRPVLGNVILPIVRAFDWQQRTQLVRLPGPANIYRHFHLLVVRNPDTVAITVACKAYRLGEV